MRKITFFVCLCDCGEKIVRRTCDITSGKIPSCGCVSNNRFIQPEATIKTKKLEDVYVARIMSRAKRKNIIYDINLNKEYLWSLFVKQNFVCKISGIQIYFGRTNFCHETTASLDRIDSNKGYIKTNVQWVHKDINKMKKNFKQEYFIELCKNIYKTQIKKQQVMIKNSDIYDLF